MATLKLRMAVTVGTLTQMSDSDVGRMPSLGTDSPLLDQRLVFPSPFTAFGGGLTQPLIVSRECLIGNSYNMGQHLLLLDSLVKY